MMRSTGSFSTYFRIKSSSWCVGTVVIAPACPTTIYKWETGKCMPDYSIIHKLCDALHVTRPELMDGEDAAEDSVRVYDDAQILDPLHRTQELERQKGILYGVALITLGIASSAMSGTVGGTDVRDFISGILMGLSVVEILAGIGIVGKKLLKQ